MEKEEVDSVSRGAFSLGRAVARSCRRGGKCKWLACAEELFRRIKSAGFSLDSLEIVDGWGEETEKPFFWGGDGEFSLYFYAKTAEEGQTAQEKIRAILEQMREENLLQIDGAGSGGFFEPFFWIKSCEATSKKGGANAQVA